MKKKSLIVFMIMAVLTAMCFTACGKSAQPTLESYLNDHPDIQASIDEQLGSDELKNITVEFKGNDMIYTYDLAGVESVTEEQAKSDEVKQKLQEGLDAQTESFKTTANSVLAAVNEDGAGIESINMVVNYVYGDEVVATGTFTSDPAGE